MASNTREVITLQLGHYANFVGAHWWNIQESSFIYNPSPGAIKELNHDVMFREGLTQRGEVTYTPRLLSVDLKGSLTHLKQEGSLYDTQDSASNVLWNGDVTLHKEDPEEKNEFLKDLEKEEMSTSQNMEDEVFGPAKLYDLDNSVKSWSDYLRIHLHPRSVHIVNKYQHSNELDRFDIFGAGYSLFSDSSDSSEFEDQLHFFLEDCDQLQGCHILSDIHNGFGGLSCKVLELLQDECPNRGLATFPVYPAVFDSSTALEDVYRLVNSAVALEKLSSCSSFTAPMSVAATLWRKPATPVQLPHLSYKSALNYHSSAILAATLESLSSPYRRDNNAINMGHMAAGLTPLDRKVLAVQSSLPFALQEDMTLTDRFLECGEQLPWQPLSPYCGAGRVPTAQSVVLRGIAASRVFRDRVDTPSRLSECRSADDLLEVYLTDICTSSLNAGCVLQSKVKTGAPFPHIFSSQVTETGDISSTLRPANKGVQEVSVATSLQSSTEASKIIEKLLELCSKIDIRKYHRILDHGLEHDEFKESLNSLETLVQNYRENTEGIFS